MLNTGNVPSLADIAAVTDNNNDGFGNNGWWVIILILALFGGWGNGFGGNNHGCVPGGGCASTSDVQNAVNQQTLYTKLDGQTYGIADLGYALNTQFGNAELSRANQQAALVAQITANNTANASNFAQVRYDMATNNCAIRNDINQAAQNIMQNDNANYRQLHDEIVAIQMENLKTQISQKDAQIFNLELKASQEAQSNYIISQTRQPLPIPSYTVPNPYCNCATNTSCCNC